MCQYLRFSIVPAILVGIALLLHAQDAPQDPARGKVLLLKNGQAMEGEIEKAGSQFCVRRGRSELWIAEDRVIRLCADWNDAYVYAQKQIKADSAFDRLRLARWCHLHRLTDKALEQAQIALELQPSNAEAKQLVTMLERALIEPKVQPTENKKPEAAPAAPSPASEPTPTVDVSFDTLVAFTSKVQPILMNKCAICHANGEGGSFHLDRVSDAGSKATTQRNLAAVLRQIDLEHPAISPLLVKAITRHGDAKAPAIRDRSDKPMVAMQQWVELAVARNPQLKDYARKQSPTKTIPEPKGVFPSQRSSKSPEGSSVISQSAPRLEIDAKNPPRVQPVEVKEMPIATTTPADEFDALHFNRWAHPALYQQQTVNARSQ